nr:putative ribonuclease H-like domain-containing protein [Tanacetum cinerariifolium]
MHKAFPLPGIEFPLAVEVPTASEEDCHCQKKRDATARKFEQWQFRIQQYLQHEHYALWEVIEFKDSYVVPASSLSTTTTDTTIDESSSKSRRTVTLTAEDMQKKKNDVKERTTLLLSLLDEHQLRFTKHSSGNKDGNTACVPTASTNVPTASASVATISQDTAYAYIASQSSGSQIKFGDINQIDEDDTEKMDIKWNMALVECFNCHKMGHFARECRALKNQDRGRRDNYRQGSKAEEQAPKALMAIDGVGWDWSYMENDEEYHALVADEVPPTEFALMANTSSKSKVFDNSLCLKDCKKNYDSLNSKITDLTDKLFDANNLIYHYKLALAEVESRLVEYKEREVKYCEKIKTLEFHTESDNKCIEILKKKLETLKEEKEGVDGKLACLLKASKDLDNLIESQMPSPTVESTSGDDQNRNTSIFETVASPIIPKPFIKLVKPKDSQSKSKTGKIESPKKPPVKYAEQYRKPIKKPNGSSQNNIDDKGYWDSGCSRHMTGNISYLSDYEPFDGGYVSFSQGGCKITGKRTIKTGKLEFENVYFVKDLKTPRQHNMYSIDLNNIVPHRDLTCLVAKASADECMLWHWRLGHLNFKTIIEAARTMLADAKLPVTSWAKAVNTACYVQNRVLVNKSHNKSPYELFNGRSPAIGILKPFGYHVMILNTLDNLGKFEEKGDEVDADTISTNLSVSLKIIAEVPEGSGNTNPTTSTSNPLADQMETLKVETPIPTTYFKRVANQEETPSLDNILSLTNRFEDILRVSSNSEESNGVEADISNMETAIIASPTPTLRIHKDHPKSQIIGPMDTPIQTRNKSKEVEEQSFITTIYQKIYPSLLQFYLFSWFLSQVEPKKIFDALHVLSWVEAMQEELLQFKIQNVWTLVDCPKGVRPIMTKWVLKNKKDERGIVNRNKARLVDQGYTQEEGIDYDEVFTPVARIKAIRLFLAYVSFMGFTVYQMDVKSAFLYGTIDEEVYVMQPPRFQDLKSPAKVYKVEKAMYGLHQAPRAWRILCGKDGTGKDVNIHLYRSMIGSLMYLTASRPDIMFAICACARHQVTPKECHLHAVKRIFRYLKGHPKLGLWDPKESPFDLVAYSDSDYDGATQDCKSTTGGCQFFSRRLISWQCKKQTIMATSTTEAEYVTAASCYLLTKPFDAGRFKYLVCKLFPLLGKLSTVSVFLGLGLTFAGTSKYWSVLRILMISLRLIPLTEHNSDFHPMVDFIEASPLRRNLKLQDKEGISSLLDTELFENLTLMGYNISPNQKFTFQKGQFSYQWKIVSLFDTMLVQQGEGSGTPTEPHHTPSPAAKLPSHTTHSSPTLSPVTTTRIAQFSALPTIADEPASPLRDVSQGEVCPTDSGFIAVQDKATIAKPSTLPHDSAPRVTSPTDVERSMQQTILELTALCTRLHRQLFELTTKFQAQEVEINRLKDRVKLLEDREGVAATRSGDDAPIKGRSMDEGEAATERISDDSEEMATVLAFMDAATVLASEVVDVPTGSGSIPTANTPAKEQVPTGSDVVPTASLVFATATVVTPYRRRKGKEVMVESETPKKQKEYHQFTLELPMERRIELITDLVKYQDNYAKIYKYQSQQRKPMIKKHKRDYYMAVIRNNLGWKVKDFRGMTFEEVKAKFNSVWKQMEDFLPMGSKEEAERIKRKGLNLKQESAKKQKTSEEVPEEAMSPEEVSEEKVKEMMQLVPIEEVYIEALQVKHPIIDWKFYHWGQRSYWKITRSQLRFVIAAFLRYFHIGISILIQVAIWLKTFEEFTRGWVRLECLDVDTQTTWMQHGHRETRVESKNGCSYKTFKSCGAKEFFGTKREVGILSWLEEMDYEMEIANGLWIETNKSICGYRFDPEGHTFINDLVPFRLGSFDVIMGIDWLSKRRAKIVCFEKIVQIPLSNRKILEANGEQPEEDMEPFPTNYTESIRNTTGFKYRLPSQTNGQSELTIQTLEDILRACAIDFGGNWDTYLSFKEFWKRSKLSPRYVGPYEIVERVSPVAYRLHLPQELIGFHDMFHVSNLKKNAWIDANLHVPSEEVKIDEKLHLLKNRWKSWTMRSRLRFVIAAFLRYFHLGIFILMALVMNLELKLVVAKVNIAEQKFILNGCLDWNEIAANDEIQAYTYYCQLKVSAAKSKFTTVSDVYTSCIKQFWATAKVKNVKGEAHIQALVDKKKVIITEASIRRDLSSTMAFAVICLATNKKFNFLKYIFDNMKKQKSRRKQMKEIEVPSPSSEIPNEEGVPITSDDPLPSAKEIVGLKKIVKKLEQKRKSRTSRLKRLRKVGSAMRVESLTEAILGDQEDASKQGRLIDNIVQDIEVTLVDDTQGRMNEEDMFGVNDLDVNEVVVDVLASEKEEQSVKVVENEVSTADPVTSY